MFDVIVSILSNAVHYITNNTFQSHQDPCLHLALWKCLDDFAVTIYRYIFFPLGGSHGGVVRQTLASVACFLFVYLWHGSEYYVFLWTLFNFVGVVIERIAQGILGIPAVMNTQVGYFIETHTHAPTIKDAQKFSKNLDNILN